MGEFLGADHFLLAIVVMEKFTFVHFLVIYYDAWMHCSYVAS